MAVFIAWLVARVTGIFGSDNLLLLSAVADMVFICGLLIFIAIPIIKQRQLKQIGILVKVAILGLGNLAFYLGAANFLENGVFQGLYTGLYLVIALILTLGRRVIPFFIESRLRLENPLKNRKWVEIGSLLLFLVFWIGEVFSQRPQIGAVAAVFSIRSTYCSLVRLVPTWNMVGSIALGIVCFVPVYCDRIRD